jgi:hypothetical protein
MMPESARLMPKIADAPGPEPLLVALRPWIDDAMLREIAAADYGDKVEAHLAALAHIRARAAVPGRIDWVPGEVLELIRWSMPDDPAWAPGGHGGRGHLMRAFACAALLSGARLAVNRERSLGYADTLVQLLGSIRVLDLPLHAPALALLEGVLTAAGLDDFAPAEGMLMLVATLWLQMQAERADIVAMTATLDDLDRLRAAYADAPGAWATGAIPTLSHAGLKEDAWRDLARAMIAALPATLPAALADRVRDVAGAVMTAA